MIALRVEAPTQAVRGELNATRHRLANFPALHRRMGTVLLEWAQRNLEAEGALLEDFPSGWPALSPRTLAARLRRGRGTRMLLDSGRLLGGFTVLPSADGATVDNPVPYSRAHQLGLGVPRRPIFPSAPQAQRLASAAAQQHITEALG